MANAVCLFVFFLLFDNQLLAFHQPMFMCPVSTPSSSMLRCGRAGEDVFLAKPTSGSTVMLLHATNTKYVVLFSLCNSKKKRKWHAFISVVLHCTMVLLISTKLLQTSTTSANGSTIYPCQPCHTPASSLKTAKQRTLACFFCRLT